MPIKNKIAIAFEEGKEARLNAIQQADCPYDKDTNPKLYWRWIRGWEEQDKALKQ